MTASITSHFVAITLAPGVVVKRLVIGLKVSLRATPVSKNINGAKVARGAKPWRMWHAKYFLEMLTLETCMLPLSVKPVATSSDQRESSSPPRTTLSEPSPSQETPNGYQIGIRLCSLLMLTCLIILLQVVSQMIESPTKSS